MKPGCWPLVPWLWERDAPGCMGTEHAAAKGWCPARHPDGARLRLAQRSHQPPQPPTRSPLTALAPFASLTRRQSRLKAIMLKCCEAGSVWLNYFLTVNYFISL